MAKAHLPHIIALSAVAALSSMPFTGHAFDIPPHKSITESVLSGIHVPIRGINRTFSKYAIKQVNAAHDWTDSPAFPFNAALWHPEWHFTNEVGDSRRADAGWRAQATPAQSGFEMRNQAPWCGRSPRRRCRTRRYFSSRTPPRAIRAWSAK
jgi:hypothetical protein